MASEGDLVHDPSHSATLGPVLQEEPEERNTVLYVFGWGLLFLAAFLCLMILRYIWRMYNGSKDRVDHAADGSGIHHVNDNKPREIIIGGDVKQENDTGDVENPCSDNSTVDIKQRIWAAPRSIPSLRLPTFFVRMTSSTSPPMSSTLDGHDNSSTMEDHWSGGDSDESPTLDIEAPVQMSVDRKVSRAQDGSEGELAPDGARIKRENRLKDIMKPRQWKDWRFLFSHLSQSIDSTDAASAKSQSVVSQKSLALSDHLLCERKRELEATYNKNRFSERQSGEHANADCKQTQETVGNVDPQDSRDLSHDVDEPTLPYPKPMQCAPSSPQAKVFGGKLLKSSTEDSAEPEPMLVVENTRNHHPHATEASPKRTAKRKKESSTVKSPKSTKRSPKKCSPKRASPNRTMNETSPRTGPSLAMVSSKHQESPSTKKVLVQTTSTKKTDDLVSLQIPTLITAHCLTKETTDEATMTQNNEDELGLLQTIVTMEMKSSAVSDSNNSTTQDDIVLNVSRKSVLPLSKTVTRMPKAEMDETSAQSASSSLRRSPASPSPNRKVVLTNVRPESDNMKLMNPDSSKRDVVSFPKRRDLSQKEGNDQTSVHSTAKRSKTKSENCNQNLTTSTPAKEQPNPKLNAYSHSVRPPTAKSQEMFSDETGSHKSPSTENGEENAGLNTDKKRLSTHVKKKVLKKQKSKKQVSAKQGFACKAAETSGDGMVVIKNKEGPSVSTKSVSTSTPPDQAFKTTESRTDVQAKKTNKKPKRDIHVLTSSPPIPSILGPPLNNAIESTTQSMCQSSSLPGSICVRSMASLSSLDMSHPVTKLRRQRRLEAKEIARRNGDQSGGVVKIDSSPKGMPLKKKKAVKKKRTDLAKPIVIDSPPLTIYQSSFPEDVSAITSMFCCDSEHSHFGTSSFDPVSTAGTKEESLLTQSQIESKFGTSLLGGSSEGPTEAAEMDPPVSSVPKKRPDLRRKTTRKIVITRKRKSYRSPERVLVDGIRSLMTKSRRLRPQVPFESVSLSNVEGDGSCVSGISGCAPHN